MSIQRCELRMSDGDGGMFQADDGRWVTYDDHEATVRLRMAEAERNGRQAARLSLEWACGKWGMTDAEMAKHETFGKLLAAFEKRVGDCVVRQTMVADPDGVCAVFRYRPCVENQSRCEQCAEVRLV